VLVRRDLPAAQIGVQAIHAAIEAARHFSPPDRPHPHLVLCRVPSERDLLSAADRLDRLGINFQLFREPDRAGEATALATEPLGPDRRGPLARYPCLTRSDLLSAPEPEPEPRGSAAAARPVGSLSGGCAMT
jgi:hypothetical protein